MWSRRKKDKNGLNILGNKSKIKKKSKLLKRLIAFFTFLSTLPFIFHVFIIIVGMSLILIASAGILQFFQEEENIVEEYDIDWGSYTCSCTFLTAEQIAQVRNGEEVKIDIDNSGGLNISGGDVVDGYLWGSYPMELFILSTCGERGSSEESILACVGDYGQAYGLMQLDYRYDLVDFMKLAYADNAIAWDGFKDLLDISKGDTKLVNNQKIIDAFNYCYKNYPEVYMKFQPDFFAKRYLYNDTVNRILTNAGINLNEHSIYVSAALFSCNVNCGEVTGTKNFIKAGARNDMTDEELLDCVYKGWRMYRTGSSWSQHGHRLAIDKSGEEGLALQLLHNEIDPATYNNSKTCSWGAGWDGPNSVRIATGGSKNSSNVSNDTTISFGKTGTGLVQSNTDIINNSNEVFSVESNSMTYTNGQEIGLDSSWTYANESVINSGKAIYYAATDNRKDICIAVNAGHGTSNVGSKKTYCHPDHTAKVTGGTTGAGEEKAVAVSSGMTFNDGVSEAVANLKVAQAMKDDLLSKGYDVLMIRDGSDVQLDNVARTVISNNIADAHVAIHFNSTYSDSGAFYMSVPSNTTYRAMEPVASHWQEHNALGDSLIIGLKNNSINVKSSSALEQDLTQTSYSEIPSVDIELGDHETPHGDEECKKFGEALSDGIDEFFKTHTPINQSKRVTSNLGVNTSNNTNNNSSSNRVINKNKANLRTSCQMKTEGICGCYVSDPNCMCHIFGGDDGVLGTEDDNISQSKGDTGSGNIEGLTAEQSAAINAAREAMMAIAMAMKEQQPDLYKEGLTTTVGNSWYTNQLSGKCPKLTVTINGNQIPFGIRPDCSGLMTVTMIRLGVNLNSCYSTTDFGDNQNVIASTGLFEVLPYDRSILQPGDIICRYPSGHIEMFYKDLGDRLLHYSWGSTASAQHSFNVETEQLYDYDDIKPGGWQNYRIIFRYKGGK